MSKGSQILNYTTMVEASRTVADIATLLAAKQAASINMDYSDGKVIAITFVIRVANSMVPFRLTPNVSGVASKLPNKRDVVRAERVAWRIVLRWVEAQLAMVEANQAEMGQVFLPYAVSGRGETFWQAFQISNMKQLTTGGPDAE